MGHSDYLRRLGGNLGLAARRLEMTSTQHCEQVRSPPMWPASGSITWPRCRRSCSGGHRCIQSDCLFPRLRWREYQMDVVQLTYRGLLGVCANPRLCLSRVILVLGWKDRALFFSKNGQRKRSCAACARWPSVPIARTMVGELRHVIICWFRV